MRIAFVMETFPQLSETFILNQITGLIDRGHDVEIIAARKGKTDLVHPAVMQYRLMERTHFQPVFEESPSKRIVKGVWLLLRYGWRHPVVVARSLNVWRYGEASGLRLLFPACGAMICEPYDIIHCHFGPNGMLASRLREIGALRGNVLGTVFHGYDMSSLVKCLGTSCYARLFRDGDVMLPISARWEKQLQDMGCPQDKIAVHHMGVDTTAFPFRTRMPEKDGTVRIISIARLVEKKGIHQGLVVFAKVADSNQKLFYQIVGDGPCRSELERLCEELCIKDRVQMLGWRNQEEVYALLKNAHLLLAPSITSPDGDQEGIPVIMMEAMAMGLPVLSTFHSGIPELVQHGVSGFLASEKDIDALAHYLKELLCNPEHWQEMGRAGRKIVEDEFDINKLNDRLVGIYQDLLMKKHGLLKEA